MKLTLLLLFAIPVMTLPAQEAPGPAPTGMVWIPGGEFTMGTDDPQAWPAERPAHRAAVDGFFMDVTEVTNAQFAAFVEGTGYVTVAERPVNWDELKLQLPPGTPKPPDEALAPGSLVFMPTSGPVPLDDYSQWWQWVPGANWRHPEGPKSSIERRANHPVVHVAYEDAKAYADWAGKRLPTEAEWERAARGGLDGARYVWGDEDPTDDGPCRANIWQGQFPYNNLETDGFLRSAPVKSFEPNGYGLYDMSGNVWEWCSDWYRFDTYARRAALGEVVRNPKGPDTPRNPNDPRAIEHVTRGGSFLCHASYCASYRPSARIGTAYDSGMSHLGFRCVKQP